MIRLTTLILSIVGAGALAICAPPLPPREAQAEANTPAAARPNNPILSAEYHCRLQGDDLVGSAEWSIRTAGPARISLAPLSIAIRKAHWVDMSPAVIAVDPGVPGPRLLVERAGDNQVHFDWSARGDREPAGWRFPIQVPASPIAVLTLNLPDNVSPRLDSDQSILSGPTPDNGRSIWTVFLGGVETLNLRLIARPSAEPAPFMISRQRNRHTITIGQIASEFAIELELARKEIRQLRLHCDSGFEPTEVAARNLAGWQFGPSGTLTIDWREAFSGGEIVIRGISSAPANGDWSIPSVTAIGAVQLGETVTLQAAPDVSLSDCRPGSFRIVESIDIPNRAGSSLLLRSGVFRDGERRPLVRIGVADGAVRMHERLWWRLDVAGTPLIAQLSVESLRGAIAESKWRLPPNYSVDHVAANEPDALAAWRVINGILVVDWSRPLTVGREMQLTVHLSARRGEPAFATEALAVPDLIPLGSVQRTGLVAVKAPSNFRAIGETTLAARLALEESDSSPWGVIDPDLVLLLKPGSRIQLQARPNGFGCLGTCRLSVTADAAAATYRLHIEPRESPLSSLVLRSPPGCPTVANWRVVQGRATVQSVDRLSIQPALLALAATTPNWLAVVPSAINGEWLQITLARPVAEPFDLECRCSLEPGKIPLFDVVGSLDPAWQTTIDSSASPQWDVRSATGRPLWRTPDSSGCRTFRGGPDVLSIAARSPVKPAFDEVRLIVDASTPGQLSHTFRLGVTGWRFDNVGLTLPAGVHSVAVMIDGMSAAIQPVQLADGRWRLDLPARTGDRWMAEIRYTTLAPIARLYDHLRAEIPTGNFDLPAPRTEWVLPRGWIPTPQRRCVEAASTADAVEGPTSWIAVDSAEVNSIEIIRPAEIQRVCIAIAALLCCLCGFASDRNVARGGVVIGCFLGFAAIWLPSPWNRFCWPPLVACAILILRPYLAQLFRGRVTTFARPKIESASAIGLLTFAVWTTTGHAAPRAGDPIPSTALPIRAEYVGVVKGNTVEVAGQFDVFVSGSQASFLTLPWIGLKLLSATLDGRPCAFTVATNTAQFQVTGSGWHHFTVAFTTECSDQDERKIEFPIIPVNDCSLTIRAPKPAINLEAMNRRGAAHVTSEAEFKRLEADLGAVDRIQVRWNRASTTAEIRSEEAYLWILEEQSARLLGDLKVTVAGAVANVQIDLPEMTAVKSVTAHPVGAARDKQPARLRDWRVVGANADRLAIEFSNAITGSWLIELELAPIAPLSPEFTLKYPRAQAATSQAVCAWRASGLRLEEVDHGDLRSIEPAVYRQEELAAAPLDLDRAFRRSDESKSEGIRLRLAAERSTAPANPAAEERSVQTGSDRQAQRRLAPPTERDLRISATDLMSVEIGDGNWIHRLTAQIDAAAPTSLAVVWPQSVKMLTLTIDDDALVLPVGFASRISLPLDRRRLSGIVACTWRTLENRGELRYSMPRFESGTKLAVADRPYWRLLPLPGHAVVGGREVSMDFARNGGKTFGARLPFVDQFADRSRTVWNVTSQLDAVTIVDPASADSSTSSMRSVLLLALLAAAATVSKWWRPLEALEIVVVLSLFALIVTWEWPWLLPAAFIVALWIGNFVLSRQFAPRSVA